MAGLPGLFPIYPENPVSGPFHVSLSLPGPISEISKSIGVTASSSLLIPNVDYLIKFANGNIGIGDDIKKSMMLKNINKCKTEDAFKQFAKLVKLDIPDPSKYKTNNGYSVPKNLITVDPSEDMMGIKAMEKTILKSIFETQKPYMEIVKLVVGNIAKIEDIIARVMPILAPASTEVKLTIKSEKPKTNAGIANNRPKALGYNNGIDIKPGLGKIDSLSKKGKEVKIDKDGNTTTSPKRTDPSDVDIGDIEFNSNSEDPNGVYQVISTVYSTGEFDPNANYKYIYKDIKDDSFDDDDLSNTSDLDLEDDDPYKKLKPKNVIFGIYNSKGELINPFSKVKSLGPNGEEIDTPFFVADWITRSPKWYFSPGQYSWPRFGAPFYYWERYGGSDTRRSQSKPDPGENQPDFSRKKYDDGVRKGEDIVDFTGTSEKDDFIDYFTDLVSKKINASDGLDPIEKQQYINEVISKLYEKDEEGTRQVGPYTLEKTQIDNHLDNAFKYSVLNTIFINPNNNQPIDMPSGLKFPLKPGRMKVENKDIWMDPESDYDLKVIKVDSVLDIRYEDSSDSPEIETQILSFIKNSLTISVDDNTVKMPFSIKIGRNQEVESTFENITEYQLDNWNYNDSDGLLGPVKPEIDNTNSYNIEVWRYSENQYFVGRNSVSFPLQNNIFIEMERDQSDWIYREYEVSSSNQTITPNVALEYNVSGAPTTNGEEVTKVKILKVTSTQSSDFFKVSSWYYKKNNVTNWYAQPPNSWVKSNFVLEWQSNSVSYNSNGSLPQTRLIDTTKYTIESSGLTSSLIWKFMDILKINETRTYVVVSDGEKTLGEGSLVEVENYRVKRWIVWRTSLSVGTSINGKLILPEFRKNNDMSLVYSTFGNNNTLDILSTVTDIPAFQIRVKDTTKYGKMIDPSKITNDHLTLPELYSSGKYGGSPQEVENLKRYMLTELDTETYYIVEGVLVDENNKSGANGNQNANPTNQSGPNTEWYRMPNALGATKVFLSLLSDVFSKLVPAIKKLLALFKNPASFVTDIISEKLGESFLIFSPDAMKVMKKMPNIPIPGREEFIKNSVLRNYVSVNPDGSYRFLLDGEALMKLPILGNTITFGMQLKMLTPLIKLIFKIDFNDVPNNTLNSFLNKEGKNKPPLGDLGNVDLRPNQNTAVNQIKTEANGRENIEEVSIQYSTGKFIQGVDYQYIYLTEYVSNLIKEADDLELTNDPDNLELAIDKLELAHKSDPENKLIEDKLKDLRSKVDNYIQPILKFLIEIVSLPIKIIAKIIEQIMAFFKGGEFGDDKNFPGLKSLPSLPSNMAKFLSFQWIIGLFKPMNLLEMAGIKFDIPTLLGWISNLKNYPNNHEFDLSEVINIDLLVKLPKVKKDQFIDMLKKPLRILYSVLCLLESLINSIIDLIWSLLGIEAIIPAPHIKLCKQLNEDMSTEDIMDLLNGLMKDPGASAMSSDGLSDDSGDLGGNGDGSGYNFIYEIKLSNGKLLRDLNEEELRKFIEENKDISFDFLFD